MHSMGHSANIVRTTVVLDTSWIFSVAMYAVRGRLESRYSSCMQSQLSQWWPVYCNEYVPVYAGCVDGPYLPNS